MRDPGAGVSRSYRLAVSAPWHGAGLFDFFAQRAVPGAESATEYPDGRLYRRAVRLAHGHGLVSVSWPPAIGLEPVAERQTGSSSPAGPPLVLAPVAVGVETIVADGRDHDEALALARRLFDLDAVPEPIDAHLAADPVLAPLVARRPGVRVPGTADAHELVVRAIIGQQVSVVGARTIAGRLAERYGQPLEVTDPSGSLHRQFPSAGTLAGLEPQALPMPRARGGALIGACRALAEGDVVIGPGADPEQVHRALVSLPGIGPWTADYVILRCLDYRDVFLPTDLAIRHALARLGLEDPRQAQLAADGWRPWRSYATLHLWLSLADPLPRTGPLPDHT